MNIYERDSTGPGKHARDSAHRAQYSATLSKLQLALFIGL